MNNTFLMVVIILGSCFLIKYIFDLFIKAPFYFMGGLLLIGIFINGFDFAVIGNMKLDTKGVLSLVGVAALGYFLTISNDSPKSNKRPPTPPKP